MDRAPKIQLKTGVLSDLAEESQSANCERFHEVEEFGGKSRKTKEFLDFFVDKRGRTGFFALTAQFEFLYHPLRDGEKENSP
jgi:hypothetical protein